MLEFQNVPGCGLRALVGHLRDLTESGKHSEEIQNYVNLRQKVGTGIIPLYKRVSLLTWIVDIFLHSPAFCSDRFPVVVSEKI